MSSGSDERERARLLLARLQEAYHTGKVSREVYERLSRKYGQQLNASWQTGSELPQGRLRPGSLPVETRPRIVAIDKIGYRPVPARGTNSVRVAAGIFVAFFVMLILILIIASIPK